MKHYENDIENLQIIILEDTKKSRFYALIRLCLIILILVFLYLAQQHSIFYALSLLLLLCFLGMVKIHDQIKKKIEYMEEKVSVINKLVRRKDDRWKKEEFIYDEHADSVSLDLDILGKSSLYQYINMAHTPYGKENVKQLLTQPQLQNDEIKKRQDATKELLTKYDFLLAAQTYSSLFGKHSKKINSTAFNDLIDYAKTYRTNSSFLSIVSNIMRIMTWIALLLCITNVITIELLFIVFSLNMILTLICFSRVNASLSLLHSLKGIVEDYQELIKHVCQEQLEDAYLQTIQQDLQDADEGIHKLLTISTIATCRANLLTHLILNSLLLIDIFCVQSVTKWKKQYGNKLEFWFETFAEFEGLCSLCVIGQAKEAYCFPDIIEGSNSLCEMENAKHPLIQEGNAIANSMKMESNSYIITGSNMSGKTTFLRTIGVNLILAYAGAPVCASAFKSSLMHLYTSMRVKDDVSEGISTFYAELLRIKQMMQATKRKEPMLVLIDEIFKGTNSADRILCATTAIRKLHLPLIITLVSTHDFELCELEKDEDVQAINYHFEEYYTQDEIHFDYRLKEGKCTTTNAKELMRLAGF